ncbi:Cmx/CmrA family chloramphenicol efflux MFS transporter [Actinomadura xylanilytica]|uniref:Cmx/CmrA family chloramphenicol efflux MFS transporter n=1 Tax=Actinomadura xylanilytica TaxID=887459 RepID=UPI00255A75D0|nr:Cmx/CmrA family chloramphenicol efflux MFS transporter [Actinomadura xylanilytica]MDL4775569.1 MFS transporter [Actinomadura xylanilytica]
MPVAVYVLALSLFAMGASEFLMAGVLPDIAADLDVSLPTAGTLISAFAVGVLVGAPPLAALTRRWPPRTTLLICQAAFAAAIASGLVVPGYWAVLISRAVAGVAYAGFWAVAAATAISLVPPDRTARALGVVVTGLSLAMVVGGPAGTVIGEWAGWQAGYWAVVALTAATAIAARLTLPATEPVRGSSDDLREELRLVARPRLWVAYGTTMLTTAAYMVTYGYLGSLLTDTSGIPVAWMPAVLALFGVGAFAGLAIGGRTTDRYPFPTLYAGIAGVIGTSVVLALLAGHATAAVPLVFLLGVSGFLTNPVVLARVFTIATGAPTLAGATNISVLQLGITLAPLAGGLAIGAGLGLASVGWVGALFALASLAAAVTDARLHRRETTAERPLSRTEVPV